MDPRFQSPARGPSHPRHPRAAMMPPPTVHFHVTDPCLQRQATAGLSPCGPGWPPRAARTSPDGSGGGTSWLLSSCTLVVCFATCAMSPLHRGALLPSRADLRFAVAAQSRIGGLPVTSGTRAGIQILYRATRRLASKRRVMHFLANSIGARRIILHHLGPISA